MGKLTTGTLIRFRNLLMLFSTIPALALMPVVTHCSPSPVGRAAEPVTRAAEAKVDDAVAKAEQAIRFADEQAGEANAAAAEINNLSVFKSADDAALLDLHRLTGMVGSIVRDDLFGKVAAGKKELNDAKAALEKARDNLPADLTEEQKAQAKAAASAAIERIEAQTTRVGEAETGLKSALKGLYEDAKLLAGKLAKRVAALDAKKRDEEAASLLPILARDLTAVADTERLRGEFADDWESLSATLKKLAPKLGLTEEEAKQQQKGVDDALAAVRTAVESVAQKLDAWLVKINAHAEQKKVEAAQAEIDLLADPVQHAAKARQVQGAISQLTEQLAGINAGWDALALHLRDASIANFDFQNVSNLVQRVETHGRALSRAVVKLETNLAGDFSGFTADRVSLFYFTDVPRLMQVLNPATYEVGGVKGLREQAQAARRSLQEADILFAEAQAEVNTFQTRLRQLREEQRQAEASLLSTEDLLLRAKRRVDELNARPDKDQGLITRATQRRDDLQSQRDAENERVQALRDEQKGLPAKIREAERKLTEAQLKVSRERTDLLLLAQSESDAFARARDNTPFFYAPADRTSADPSKRVLMYAFGDDKTIFLRGKVEDLKKVKTIIALFDRPAPQSRMTLWSLELSSTADNKGTRKFNEALKDIEGEMAYTRARIAASLSFLRDCINEQVHLVAQVKLNAAGITTPNARQLQWARMHFYQREVLLRLGFNPDSATHTQSAVSNLTLPDPTSTTTLGEALMVLILANPQSRWAVISKFSADLRGKLDGLGLKDPPLDKVSGVPSGFAPTPARWFAGSKRAMGLDSQPSNMAGLTADQFEIVRALSKGAQLRIVSRLSKLLSEQEMLLREQQAARTPQERNVVETKLDNLQDQILPILEWLWNELEILPQEALTIQSVENLKAIPDTPSQARQTMRVASSLLRSLRAEENPLRVANERVAAADEMIKRIIIAFEDDLNHHFIDPMMQRLRTGLAKKNGIGVGIINRTSMLATNRLIARVDARGSAQLSVGEETDILGSIQQLAQIALAGQTGGLLGVLGSLNAQPQRDVSELYGLTTNGTFQITPIFDPSGQALRFKLDQVFSNLVRDPDGTINPQLPRIERHTVNTEVQLSNLEIREVSRFNSNARLGIPTKTTGGIPILKDIKYVRDIPLLGWFVRRKGSAAVTQQSLIFGQTTLYPTIGDIMGLLQSEDYFDMLKAERDDCPCNEPSVDKPLLPDKTISLHVTDADLRDITKYITEEHGVNFFIDPSVGRIPVTINVTEVPLNEVLDTILKANRLGLVVNGNILRIAPIEILFKEAEDRRKLDDVRGQEQNRRP
ncbi:MAG TPA: hypothetical protein VGV59_10145 [Pyrinomonadaceae bacterium]|nr:hypothetical protein [Pyrinomonadaceae bacterium]